MHEKPSKLMPALYGGIIIGLISGIPFLNFVNCLCCAGVLFGGVMSVFFYKKDLTDQMPPLTSGDSVQLGALAGLFGAILSTALSAVLLFTVGNVTGEAMYKMIIGVYDSMGMLNQIPPDALEQMENSMRNSGLSPLSIFISLIITPLFGLLGGLIGHAMFKPKQTPVAAPPSAQP